MYFPIIDALKESYIAKIPSIVTKWLTDNVNPVGSAVVVDESLSISRAAADAKITGDELNDLKSDLNAHSNIITDNLMGIDVQQNLYLGSADWSGGWINSDVAVMTLSDETFNGYPVMKSTQPWRRMYKPIPVESGKTYTFECWVKAEDVTSIFLHITDSAVTITNPATVSPASKKFQNVLQANTWGKLSLTFTCSASGNVSPFALSAYGSFSIAHYMLVEGDTVKSLATELDNMATKEDVSAVGDYHKYSFYVPTGTPSSVVGEYWNNEISNNIPQGTKGKLVFDSYSGQYFDYVRIDGKKSDGTYDNSLCVITTPIRGTSAEFVALSDYVAFRVQIHRTTVETDVSASVLIATAKDLGITTDLLTQATRHVFSVEKDGSGDFTSFVDAINAACGYMDSIVYVGAGEFDLLDELGESYVSSASSTKMGLVFKNRVHVIGSSQTVLKMDYDGTLDNAKEWLSPINTGEHGCTIENIRVEDNNVRYSVHDDQGWFGSTPYINKYINCTFIHKNGKYGDCIGGGLGENCCIEIRGCYLEGDANVERLAYYHANNHTGITNAKGRLTVCDNYFANVGTFKMQSYGDSTEMSTAYVSNNSFGSAPSISSGSYSPNDNVEIKAWNNEIRS